MIEDVEVLGLLQVALLPHPVDAGQRHGGRVAQRHLVAMTLQVASVAQLAKVMSRVEQLKDVLSKCASDATEFKLFPRLGLGKDRSGHCDRKAGGAQGSFQLD